ncbi:hypothetical protein HYV88_04565 [Candidatus Woesearchaeota archaeon]|nr:hypothetical protein [Candidatus Woesearchaeota archaeon]
MNKKAQFLGIIAILSLFLVGYAYYVLIVVGHGKADYNVGEHSTKWLIIKEIKLNEIDFYYEQAFKNAIFKTISEISENGGGKRDLVWNDNPYPDVKTIFKNSLEKNFRYYLNKASFEAEYEIILPKNFEITIEDNKASVKFNDELVLRDRPLDEECPDEDCLSGEKTERTKEDNLMSISKKLKYEYNFKRFSLSVFERIYSEFSKSNQCITKSEIFRNIKCKDECLIEKSFLDYEIPLDRVGFVVPVMKFKIPKQC